MREVRRENYPERPTNGFPARVCRNPSVRDPNCYVKEPGEKLCLELFAEMRFFAEVNDEITAKVGTNRAPRRSSSSQAATAVRRGSIFSRLDGGRKLEEKRELRVERVEHYRPLA